MAFRGRRGLLVAAMLVSAISGATACTATGGTAVKVTTTGPATGSTAAAPSTSSGASGAGPATSPSTFPLPVAGTGDGLLWSQNAAQPLGQPVAVGDGVAVYVLRGSVLSIEVVDAATGKIRWQRPAATGAAAAGIEISPVLVGGHLVYLRPVQGSMTTTSVVVADAVTGKDIAVSQHDYRVGSRPVSCQHSVCFSVYVGTDQQAVNMDPATGQVISAGAGTGGRSIGPEGLQSVQDPDRPETLTRTKDSRTVWSTPLTNIFGDGYSTNGGWEFHVLPKQNMLIGSVGAYDPDQPFRGDINLGTALKMAGIDLATGARRWLQSGGVDYQCIPQAAVVEAGALVNVRCRWGAGTVAHRVGDKLTLRTASLSVEGFNPATGATTWTVPLADPTGQSPATAFHHIEVVVRTRYSCRAGQSPNSSTPSPVRRGPYPPIRKLCEWWASKHRWLAVNGPSTGGRRTPTPPARKRPDAPRTERPPRSRARPGQHGPASPSTKYTWSPRPGVCRATGTKSR